MLGTDVRSCGFPWIPCEITEIWFFFYLPIYRNSNSSSFSLESFSIQRHCLCRTNNHWPPVYSQFHVTIGMRGNHFWPCRYLFVSFFLYFFFCELTTTTNTIGFDIFIWPGVKGVAKSTLGEYVISQVFPGWGWLPGIIGETSLRPQFRWATPSWAVINAISPLF